MTIQAVIFDVGGVIVRTEEYAPRETLAAQLGMSRLALEDLVFGGDSGDRAQLGEIHADEHWENVRRAVGLPADEMQVFQNRFWDGDTIDFDLVAYIRSLRPRYRTALLSNAFSNLRHFLTEVLGIADAFDAIIISAEVGLMKPDAHIYDLAVATLGVDADEAVFVDDMPRNIEGARAAGLLAVHFETPAQVYRDLGRLLNGGAA